MARRFAENRGGRSPKLYHAQTLGQRARSAQRRLGLSHRARAQRNERLPFAPPEDWHEPVEEADGYRIVVQPPGKGYRHVVTPEDVRARLAELPPHFLNDLQVVQFSRMTHKKASFPCYGMQWGQALYLYPIEESLIECYPVPPKPAQLTEARMYGGRWQVDRRGGWRLIWTAAAIRDFYLNNILIHELGHLLDDRNTTYTDRERYAEAFAMDWGYLRTRHNERRNVTRRHHAV
ncbi:MAG: hypothetical protein K1X74_04930 [Pirellulales bacterium]|nr:hypothetical protein [Pirellulales bacterium]